MTINSKFLGHEFGSLVRCYISVLLITQPLVLYFEDESPYSKTNTVKYL